MIMMPLVPSIITSGMLLLLGMCHALLIQPHQQDPNRLYLPMRTKSSMPTRIALFSTTQAPIDSMIDDNVSKSAPANRILDHRQQLINEIGIAFAQKIFELEDFQRKNGHCLVPKRYQSNPSLGNWVNKQRQNYRRHLMGESTALNETRITALNNIGFVWNTTSIPLKSTHRENAWQSMYHQLIEFRRINGHCRVPSATMLGQWVVRQRFLYRQNPVGSSLTDERIRLLNDINFQWTTRSEELWNEHMREMREFKQQNGHALVPRNYPQNPQLSAWVATQRKNYKRRLDGKPSPLSVERVRELDEIGFVWSYWDHNFMAAQKDRLL